MNRWAHLVAPLALAVVLVAGCNGGGGDDASTAPGASQDTTLAPAPTVVESQPVLATAAATTATATTSDTQSGGDSGASAGDMTTGSVTFVVIPGSKASYTAKEEFFQGAVDRLGKALGLANAIGTTDQVSGNMTLQMPPAEADGSYATAPTLSGGDLEANINVLTSDEGGRDKRIRERWLESNTFPTASFKPTGISDFSLPFKKGAPMTFKLAGDLTVHDTTQPVVFDVSATWTDQTLSGTATTNLKMSDFGFDPPDMAGMLTVQDDFVLTVDLVMEPQA